MWVPAIFFHISFHDIIYIKKKLSVWEMKIKADKKRRTQAKYKGLLSQAGSGFEGLGDTPPPKLPLSLPPPSRVTPRAPFPIKTFGTQGILFHTPPKRETKGDESAL